MIEREIKFKVDDLLTFKRKVESEGGVHISKFFEDNIEFLLELKMYQIQRLTLVEKVPEILVLEKVNLEQLKGLRHDLKTSNLKG